VCLLLAGLQSAIMTDTDYEIRAKEFDFASDDAVREALQKSGTIILDVRTQEEISRVGRIIDSEAFPSERLSYLQSDCTVDDCMTLRLSPEDIIPNLTTNTSTIILHCASGRRAVRAKDILIQHGYLGTILNAGGYNDILKFF
jgi:rhodanese-related sulfurtransferase